jgi:transposase
VKEQVKSALSKGMTIEQASKEYGPSTFTIKAWKKNWGMVRPRKK